MRLSEHFDSTEFECHCGCGQYKADSALIEVLECMRKYADCPLIVTSGYRCPDHNAAVGGVPNSYHVLGLAADIALPEGWDVDTFADLAEQCGAKGIGKYDWGIHVDVRDYKADWDYRE